MHKISQNRDDQRELVDGAPERAIPGEAAATGRQKSKRKYDIMGNRRAGYLRMIAWQWVVRHHRDAAAKLRTLAAKKYPYRPHRKPMEEIDNIK